MPTMILDSLIRFFLYVLVFWLPYSPAVVESCVVTSLLLWILKRVIVFVQRPKASMSLWTKIRLFFQSFQLVSSPLNGPILVFLAVALLSAFLSKTPQVSLHGYVSKTLEWFVIYFLVLEVFSQKEHFYAALIVFAVTAVSTATDALVQYYWTGQDIFLRHATGLHRRATAGFKTPNALGAYLTLAVPFFVAVNGWPWKKFFQRLLVCVCLILCVWAVAVTFSRGAWLSLLLGCGLVVFFLFNKARRVIFVFLVLAAFFLAGWIFRGGLQEILSQRTDTIQWRVKTWKETLTMIKDKPILGHGPNTYMKVFNTQYQKPRGNPTYAHNGYLQLAAETGLAGLLSFLWIVLCFVQSGCRRRKVFGPQEKGEAVLFLGLFAGILAFLLHSGIDTNFYSLQLSAYLWFMMGLSMAQKQGK